VTLATWSILSGAALLVLPIDGGSLPSSWMWFGSASILGLSSSVWILVALFVFWLWFRNTRLGITIRATGSNEAFGLSVRRLADLHQCRHIRALRALCGSRALYLTTQTGAARRRLARTTSFLPWRRR